eukprot:Pgem_evm1s8278
MVSFVSSIIIFTLGMVVDHSTKVNACTDFVFKNNQGNIAVGRDLEFAAETFSDIRTIPKGEIQSSLTNVNGKIINSQYQWAVTQGYAGVTGFGANITLDGMNEAGLTCSILLLPGFAAFQSLENQTLAKTGQVLTQLNFCDWALSQFTNVKQVNVSLSSITVWGITPPQFIASPWASELSPVMREEFKFLPADTFEVHFSLHDAIGNSIVIEYTAQENGYAVQPTVYNNALGVMTNAPTYNWHEMNMNFYIGLSGQTPPPTQLGKNTFNPNYNTRQTFAAYGFQGNFAGLPADFSSQSRFTRVALWLQNALPSSNAVNMVEHILNSVDVFKGSNIVKTTTTTTTNSKSNTKGQNNVKTQYDKSQWATIRDLNRKKFYFRSYHSTQWKVIDLSSALIAPGEPIHSISISMHIGAYNATKDLKPKTNRS